MSNAVQDYLPVLYLQQEDYRTSSDRKDKWSFNTWVYMYKKENIIILYIPYYKNR